MIKNKSKLAKKVAKENVSGTTSLANNAIQNANDLSGVNKHNLRDYDNEKEFVFNKVGEFLNTHSKIKECALC